MTLVALAHGTTAQAGTEEAERLVKEGRFGEAVAAYSVYLDSLGHADGATAFNAAVCATRAGEFETAERFFSRAIAGKFNVFDAYVGKANALRELGKVEEMVAALEAGMKAGTKADSTRRGKVEAMYVAHFLARGLAFAREAEWEKAARCYTRLTRMDGTRWKTDGLVALGTLYTASGEAARGRSAAARASADFNKAREYLDRAAKLAPEDPRVTGAMERLATARERR
jgi:tetratricopeptide (TPR) repeat protein